MKPDITSILPNGTTSFTPRAGRVPSRQATWCRQASAPIVAALLAITSLLPLAACNKPAKMNAASSSSESLRRAVSLAIEGDALRKANKLALAAEKYKQSIAAKGDLGAVWVNYGWCLAGLGDYMPARDAYVRAAELLPSDPTPYENLGTLYESRGYDAKALEYYQLSLAKAPQWLPSLRGAIVTAKNLRLATEQGKQYIDDAVMIETDPDFLRIMQNERFRLESKLKQEAGNRSF